jgi:hypothetical protein
VGVARLFVVVFAAGFFGIAGFALDALAGLLPVLAEAFAGVDARTSLIALVCSCSVIRNS